MIDMTPDKTLVLVCDWQGRLVWSNDTELQLQIGRYVWNLLSEGDVVQAKQAFARTATLREDQVIEVRNQDNQRLRMQLWPMDLPETAICILCKMVPQELAKLTSREKDCLGQLARGRSTKQIAAELKIGLSTVHTHLKHIRKKLNLPREALISFAARYCIPESADDERPGSWPLWIESDGTNH